MNKCYSDKGAGGVGESEREGSGSDGGGQGAPVVVHRRQVDEHDDERQAQLDGQRLPLGQAGRDDGRAQVALLAAARHSVQTNKQTNKQNKQHISLTVLKWY